jgi:hypothetical protein
MFQKVTFDSFLSINIKILQIWVPKILSKAQSNSNKDYLNITV